MLRSAASPGSVGFGRFGSGTSGLLMTPLPTGHLFFLRSQPKPRKRASARTLNAQTAKSLPTTKKAPDEWAPRHQGTCSRPLLDLGLAELDVLFRDRVVLLLHQLVGHGAGVLPGHVVEAGIGAGNQLHFDGGGLRHGEPRSRCRAFR